MLILRALVIIVLIIAVLYLLMIMPRVVNKPSREPFTGVLYAHRGRRAGDCGAGTAVFPSSGGSAFTTFV